MEEEGHRHMQANRKVGESCCEGTTGRERKKVRYSSRKKEASRWDS
jgi:hypothetical protein